MIPKHILLITFLHKLSSFLHTVKWFYIFVSNTKISICCNIDLRHRQHDIPKTAEVPIPLAWASLADNMGLG